MKNPDAIFLCALTFANDSVARGERAMADVKTLAAAAERTVAFIRAMRARGDARAGLYTAELALQAMKGGAR